MTQRPSIFLLFLSAIILLSPWASTAQSTPQTPRRSHAETMMKEQSAKGALPYVPGHLLVRFREGAKYGTLQNAANAAVGAKVLRTYRHLGGMQLVQLPGGMHVAQGMARYRANRDVLSVDLDWIRYASGTPNDPLFPAQWALHNTGQSGGTYDADIDALDAWYFTTGSASVVVGIIDSGIAVSHEDLAANLWTNTADCNNNGIDDDGNGYIDDCHGYNAISNNSNVNDDYGHGTAMAGLIGAVGNNAKGISGVSQTVRIATCKAMNAAGAIADSDAIECMNYFAALKDHGVNIVATNNSYGGFGYSSALNNAIDQQRQRGILFVAAAMPSPTSMDTNPYYPASTALPNVLVVGDSTGSDMFDLGTGLHSVDLSAPGWGPIALLTTVPTAGAVWATPTGYMFIFGGTSPAAALATGTAALLKAYNPALTWAQIKNLIIAGGDTKPGLTGYTLSGKRLNAYGSMTCGSSRVYGRLWPTTTSITALPGDVILLGMLDINCATPSATSLAVHLDPAHIDLPLVDNGTGADKSAGDGVFTYSFSAPNTSFYLAFPGGDLVRGYITSRPYLWGTNPPYSYRNITGTNLNLSDDAGYTLPAPFPIRFGGAIFNTIYIGANGTLSFTALYQPTVNAPLPVASQSTLVAPFWDDLYPNGSRNVYWAVTGSAPNRELVIEWRDVPRYGAGQDGLTFQVVLFENRQDVLFQYKDVLVGSNTVDFGAHATVGIQVSPSSAMQYSFNQPNLENSLAILYQPTNMAPSLTSISPDHALMGGTQLTLTVNGLNFEGTSIVRWNGAARPTTYMSSTQLAAVIPASDLTTVGTAQVTVYTPAPGGGTTGAATFSISGAPAIMLSPVPESKLTSMTPTFTWNSGVGAGAYTLWVGTSAGTYNIFKKDLVPTRSAAVTIPSSTAGGYIYVRLYSNIAGAWKFNDYRYIAAGTGVAATMTSPVANSKLASTTPTFQWNTGTGVGAYTLWVGTSAGTYNIYKKDAMTTRSATVTIPSSAAGGYIYVRLYSNIGGAWKFNDYRYIAAGTGVAASMTSPTPNSTLHGNSATFNWNAGTGVTAYTLAIGTGVGGTQILLKNTGTARTLAVTNLPANNTKIYIRLYSSIAGAWQYKDYTYTSAP